MNSNESTSDIYISYESINHEHIEEISDLLRSRLYLQPCISQNLRSIKSCKIMLAFITASYCSDTTCMSELRYAQKLHKKVLLYTRDTEIALKILTENFMQLSESIFITNQTQLLKEICIQLHITQPEMSTHAIGIDFGATRSCIACIKDSKVEIISNELGERHTDSYIAFDSEHGIIIGSKAKRQFYRNSENTLCNLKYLDNQIAKLEYKGELRHFCGEEITAMVFSKLKESAEAYLGGIVADAVITASCQMSQMQLKALKNAAEAAGLHVLRIISDTSAASFALEFYNKIDESLTLIVDLGATSLSVSLVSFDKGIIEVKSTASDFGVSGQCFDEMLAQYFTSEIRFKLGIDLLANRKAFLRLKSACEELKCKLSCSNKQNIEIYDIEDCIDFYSSISREKFEEIIGEVMRERVLVTVKKVIGDVGVEKGEINDVVLVGGCARIPKLQSILREFFDGIQLNLSLDADEAVACGAAIQAEILRGGKEAPVNDLLLLDVLPRSIGVEGPGGCMQVLIKRNTSVPVKQKAVLVASCGDICLRFYEGEAHFVCDNCFLGKMDVKALIGGTDECLERFLVTVDVDANLEIFVTVEDVISGRRVIVNLSACAENRTYEPVSDCRLPVLRSAEVND